MTLSVIIPIYNEESTWRNSSRRSSSPACRDDGSSDGTPEILGWYGEDPRVRVVTHPRNRGKGAAVRSGIEYVTGDIVLIQDADLEYSPSDYESIVAPFKDGEVQVVYGSRRLLASNPNGSPMFLLGRASLTWITNILYHTDITDEPTCFKAFRRELLRSLPLRCERFEFCPEVTALVARMGIRIHEVPIRYAPRNRREGKKIGVADWLEAVMTLLRYRFAHGGEVTPRKARPRTDESPLSASATCQPQEGEREPSRTSV